MFTMFALFGVYSKKVLKCVGTASFIKPQSSEGLRLQKENSLYAHNNSYSYMLCDLHFIHAEPLKFKK